MRPWYSMKASEKGDTAEITIYDAIGQSFWMEETVSAKDFVEDLNGLGDNVSNITLRINSPGGDVFDGVAIHNAIKNHKAKVTARVDGIAASIASYIAMAADKIVMPQNSFLLLHNASGFSFGNADDMRAVADDLDRIDKSITATYATRSGQTANKVRALLKEDRLMDATEAKQLGYADEVVKEVKLAAFSDVAMRLLPRAAAERIRAVTGQQPSEAPPHPAVSEKPVEMPTPQPASAAEPVDNHPADQPAPQKPAQVIDIGTAKAQGIAEHQTYVGNVTDLCTLAGKPELVGAYVRAATPVDTVRKELLTARAAEPTIMPQHPLVDVTKVQASMWGKITDKLNARRAAKE